MQTRGTNARNSRHRRDRDPDPADQGRRAPSPRHAEVGLGVEYRYEGRCESDLGSCMGLAEWSIASDAPRSWTRVMQPHQRWRKSTISTGKAWLTGTRAPCAPMLGNPSDICKDDVRRPSVDGLKGQVTPTGRAGWTPLRRHFHPSSTGRGFFLRSQKRYRLKALKMLYKRLSDGIFARSRPGALGAAVRPGRVGRDQGGKRVNGL